MEAPLVNQMAQVVMGVQTSASWTYCILQWPSLPCVGWLASCEPYSASTLVSHTEGRDRRSPTEDKGESALPLWPRWWSDECELYHELEYLGEVDNLRLSFWTPTPEECDDLLRFCLKGCALSIWYDIYKFTKISNHNIFKFYMLISQIQRPSY